MNALPPSDQDERISAYLDGELPDDERARVERLLAEDPAARRLADGLRSVSEACAGAAPARFDNDLSSVVVAEALRLKAQRPQAEGAVDRADRLEPEGEFGLPFGRSTRSWAWAGVAAAAAVMIGFWGRPGANPPRQVATVTRPAEVDDQRLLAMQRAMPGLRVVDYQATPQQLDRLMQRVSFQRGGNGPLPFDRAAAERAGLVVEASTGPQDIASQQEQFVYFDAEQSQLDRLLAELEHEGEGATYRVGEDRPEAGATAEPPAPAGAVARGAGPARPKINAVFIRIHTKPQAGAPGVATTAAATPSPGVRRGIVLRIRLTPAP